ncbi:uncharacterized protein [Amphiura filiformis]|uniref:uncharacterized protein n=1 Tax=Amphiura filiformis TaxID=82378 RepID=UPI003B22800F
MAMEIGYEVFDNCNYDGDTDTCASGKPPPYSSVHDASQNKPTSVSPVSNQNMMCSIPPIYENWIVWYITLAGLILFPPIGILACIKLKQMQKRKDAGDINGAIKSAYWALGLDLTSVLIGTIIIATVLVLCLDDTYNPTCFSKCDLKP